MSIDDLVRELQPAPWMRDAACKGLTNLFFPHVGDGSTSKQAQTVCQGCPVNAECAEYGSREIYGVWAGTTPRQRRQPGRPAISRRKPIEHGTTRGYAAHRRHGEDACDQCKDANARRSATTKAMARAS